MLTIIHKMFRGKIEKAKQVLDRPPFVSEPVYMMIKSMRQRPQDWRFRTVEVLGLSDRDPGYWQTYAVVNAEITDRRVGYTYRVSLDVDYEAYTSDRYGPYEEERDSIVVRTVLQYPDWMTHQEMQAVAFELGRVFNARKQKVAKRKHRAENRKIAEAADRRRETNRLERERVIEIYMEA